jgi:hypothetical protein
MYCLYDHWVAPSNEPVPSAAHIRRVNELYGFQGRRWQETHGFLPDGKPRCTPLKETPPPPPPPPPPSPPSTPIDEAATLRRRLRRARDDHHHLKLHVRDLEAQLETTKETSNALQSSLKRARAQLKRNNSGKSKHALAQVRSSIKRLHLHVHPDKQSEVDPTILAGRINDILALLDALQS